MPASRREETFGVIKTPRFNGRPALQIQLTWDDLLWAIRMLEGEAGTDAADSPEGAAVLWSQASRLMWLGGRTYRTYKSLIQDHSQPINPIWRRDGRKCRPGGSSYGGEFCSEQRLRRREMLANKRWESFSEPMQNLVLNWARGQIDNPVPKAVDFADPRTGNTMSIRDPRTRRRRRITRAGVAQERGLFLVWDTRGRSIESLERGGNVFYGKRDTARRKGSENWPDNFVTIEYEGRVSESTTPEQQSAQHANRPVGSTPSARRRPQRKEDEDVLERINALAQNRTESPDQRFTYEILRRESPGLETEARDRNAAAEVSNLDVIQAPYDRFIEQVNALRRVSNLELTQTVPVLSIYARDENGDLNNLNELIFGKSTFHNYFEPSTSTLKDESPERPLASLESFSITVQQPSVGGPTGIKVSTLTIRIHNPKIVSVKHPKGKFLSYMMRQGYYLRIKWGVDNPENDVELERAFQWFKEDFFISQHEISVDNDLSMNMKLTLLPGTQKLLNQVLVGESLPINQISESDISESTDDEETREFVRAAVASANSAREFVGINDFGREDGTIGSVLHGAITHSEIVQQPENFDSVRITNLVNAFKTIQSRLLTRKFENLLGQLCYQYTRQPNLKYPAVNLGPLFVFLVQPELVRVTRLVSQDGLEIGTVSSLDVNQAEVESSNVSQNENPIRNKVRMIFGDFNSKAGQWGNKPISTFPVNIEDVFAHLRTERDVGRFSDSVNSFISRINSIVAESSNYTIQNKKTRELITPELKYTLYPDPSDPTVWIFYLYDNKQRVVQFSDLLDQIDENESLTKDMIKERLNQLAIPWIEPSHEASLIRNMTAETTGDDVIMSHNLFQANMRAYNQRQVDATENVIRSGITREFLHGIQLSSDQIIQQSTLIMPLRVSIDHYIMPTAVLFNPIYVFFPLKQFTGLYTIYEIGHEVQKNRVSTQLTLMINITRVNRTPDDQ